MAHINSSLGRNRKTLLNVALLTASLLHAENVQMETIGISEVLPESLAGNDEGMFRTLSAQTLETLQGVTATNYFKSLQMLPSVNVETHDPYALSVDQNMLRVRGQVGDTFSRLSTTLEGVPFGVNVGQSGSGYIVDRENVQKLSFASGIMPVNSALGLGSTAGALDMKLLRPSDTFGVDFSAGLGTDAFNRLFLRLDSGSVAPGVKAFVSGSKASNEKWRGEGDNSRENIEAMVTVDLGDSANIEVFGAYNSFERYEYMPLSYEQSKSLSDNYQRDYNTKLTGDAAKDVLYYGYNRQSFDEYFLMTALHVNLADATLHFKPYIFGNDGYRYMGNTKKNMVQRVDLTQEAYGATLELEYPLAGGTLLGGWWYQSLESTPPPKMNKMYTINADGSLKYKTIAMLTDVDERISNSPYISYDAVFDQTHVYAGLRYLMFSFPAVTGYDTKGIGNLSYDAAMSASSGVKTGMQVDASDSDVWLPSLLVEQYLSPEWSIGGGYARNYANPWQGPLWSVYNSNTATFSAAGITLQDLWDELKLEISDNVELFARYGDARLSAKATLFYGKYDNKQVTVYDPTLQLSYYKSDASATSFGGEAELNYQISDTTGLFASAYYNRFEFDEDILLKTDIYLHTKGNQIPDVARVGAKIGLNIQGQAWHLTPMLRYVGERFGDSENTESVNPYAVVDLSGNYTLVKDRADVTLAVQNLFNQQYIGVVKNSLDDTRSGATTYYQGAPISAVLSLNVRY